MNIYCIDIILITLLFESKDEEREGERERERERERIIVDNYDLQK